MRTFSSSQFGTGKIKSGMASRGSVNLWQLPAVGSQYAFPNQHFNIVHSDLVIVYMAIT